MVLNGVSGSSAGEATGPSSFDTILQIQKDSAERNADLYAKIDEMLKTIEEMKSLAFQINLRIARIRNGDFVRDCDAAEQEIAEVDRSLVTVDDMQKEADRLCSHLPATDTEALQICAKRTQELQQRRQQLSDSRQMLADACLSKEQGGRK